MSYNSSASKEQQQQQLPEVFRRLGKTVPPKRSYSSSQQSPQDSGFRFVRPSQGNKPHNPPPLNNFHHANYNDMVIQASTPSPPLYHRPQMNNENSTMGFYTAFSPNGNNNNNNNNTMNMNNSHAMPNPCHSPASSSVSSSTPPPLPTSSSSSSSLPPPNGFSFIPKDAIPNPNPIISFVRNPNANAAIPPTTYNPPYQFFGNGNMNQVSMNNGQQVLHPSPPIATSAPVPNAATASVAVPSASPPASKAKDAGHSTKTPAITHKKRESAGTPSSDKKASPASTPSSRKPEQKKSQKHVSSDHSGSSDEDQEKAPLHQRDILAKSIKIIASRPLGSADKTASRKHTRHSDSEASDGPDEEIIVNRKVVVDSVDMDLDHQSNGRDSSPIRKKPRRLISPTIPRRRRSLSVESDDDDRSRNTKSRYAMRSPSPTSRGRRSRSHSRSRSRSRSASRSRSHHRRRRSVSSSRSRSRTNSRSRSRSRSRQTKRRRRSVSSTRQNADDSRGLSSDEEFAPFLRGEADRYVPDYNRRPPPSPWRKRSPTARKLSSSSTAETNVSKKPASSSSSSSSPPLTAKKSTLTNATTSINDRLDQNKPKELRLYPPLGTLPMSFVSSKAESDLSSLSKQSSVKKPNPVVSHKIITKPSPGAANAKNTSAVASPALDTKKNASSVVETAKSLSQPKSSKSDGTNHTDNDSNLMPIKQEIITESIMEQPKPVVKATKVRNADAMAGTETSSQQSTPAAIAMDATQGRASSDIALNKSNAIPAFKATATATPEQQPQRKHRVFNDLPMTDVTETKANASLISATSVVEPVVNHTSISTPTATSISTNVASTTSKVTVNEILEPTKRVRITPEARAAIKKRAAKEQERLDQERLRQLDVDDRDDIVMDIAFPSQPRSPAAVKMVNKEPVMNASEKQTNNNTELIQTITATIDSTNNLANMTSSLTPNDNSNNNIATINNELVTPIVNHPTSSVLNMTSPENVSSPDTATATTTTTTTTNSTVGTNSAFTNLVTSSDNMSVPDGNTKEQIESMPLQTIPPASSLSTLESPVANVSLAVAAVAKPAAKKSSRRRLPTPWKVKMNDSGDIYYHNPVTGEETFVRPE